MGLFPNYHMNITFTRNLAAFCVLLCFSFSCKHESFSPNAQNFIELKFQENTIRFNNIKIEEDYLDLEGGLGLRAFGKAAPDNSCCNYYVIFDIKSLGNGLYRPHKINFGINKKLAPESYYQTVYYANFTQGYNTTNFNVTSNQKSTNLEGDFNGPLKTTFDDEIIEISEGKYHFNLNTVRDY